MDIDWQDGSRTVRWGADFGTERTFDRPPVSVLGVDDPPSILVVEDPEGSTARPSNALVLNPDGTERLRLEAPQVPEPSWRIGYYTAYPDVDGGIVAVYATRAGDLQGRPDLATGELREVREWR
ncbi:hypothetical protein [Kitasatospora cheerisanensis]|uniref:Uncharacterized protein n=1 Tax=Kitasatospora cheerisanensis KCTC 2395 TaxID=1348663 RepID=A0A066YLL8_9ACTN|nr:hypothetical protein [Kitasatospora cheerisanensis]KDN82363.1 hypothetical protein KCH_58700 [Kitasatospora cheerisanensis KCTC 2395]